MNPDTATAVNEHLAEAFDHLREAIMLAIAGEPGQGQIGGAMGRLERFAATGDLDILTEGMEDLSLQPRPGESPEDVLTRVTDAALQAEAAGLFDDEEFSKKVETVFHPDQDNQDAPLTPTEIVKAAEDLGAIIAKDEETGLDTVFLPEPGEEDEEEDEFSGLFDDIDEDDESDDGPSDAPAAF